MGGCRCYYRNCKVNTYNANGMHFFRFPIRDKARCDQWVKYAQVEDFYYLPIGRQRNLSVCARHFRDECFMNYKKDRLGPSSVPTIHRLSKYDAIDYEPDIVNGVLIKLPEQNAPHLKEPPAFICPLGFEFDAHASELLRQKRREQKGEMNLEYNDDCTSAATSKATSDGGAKVLEVTEITAVPITVKREIPQEEVEPRNTIKRQFVHEDYTMEVVQTDDFSSTAKRSKTCRYEYDTNMSVKKESKECHSQPVIINHQIMDNESRMWLSSSDTFNIDDQDDYQFVEVQSHPEEQSRDEIQIQHITVSEAEESIDIESQAGEEENIVTQNLKDASIEINDLKHQLSQEREKVEDLERSLSIIQDEFQRLEQQLVADKKEIQDLRNANEALEAKTLEFDIIKIQLENGQEERLKLEKDLFNLREDYTKIKENNLNLNAMLAKAKCENSKLLNEMETLKSSNIHDVIKRQEQEQKFLQEHHNHLQNEEQMRKLIKTLEENLKAARDQLMETKNEMISLKTENNLIKTDKLNAEQKILELQNSKEEKENEYNILQRNFNSILKTNTKLEADYKMLKNKQNQVSTVTTSVAGSGSQSLSTGLAPTKAQLFNGIKRYISASMCSLLRMEMFGSSEREWKPDERKAAVDILCLGETVYKYFTDEWRFRLPALRDVREWLNQSVTMDDEEDL